MRSISCHKILIALGQTHTYMYTRIPISLYVCVIHVPMCVHIHMCMFIKMYVFVCTDMIPYIHLVWLQTLENHFVSFHSVQKLLQVLHTSPTVTLYTNMHSIMLSHYVWLKGVEYKLIKQCAVFCTNTSISFLYIQKVQCSSIEHRSTQIWTKHHQLLNWLILYTTH